MLTRKFTKFFVAQLQRIQKNYACVSNNGIVYTHTAATYTNAEIPNGD